MEALQQKLQISQNKENIVNQSCDEEIQRIKENEEFMKAGMCVMIYPKRDVWRLILIECPF